MRKIWILCLALAACEGRCDSEKAAREAARPGAHCVSSGGPGAEAICVSRDRVESCDFDGVFFKVARCRTVGELTAPPAEAR